MIRTEVDAFGGADMSDQDLILRLLLQLAVILGACRLVGMVGKRLGQTQVVCEMITGVLLGPSFFGLLWPTAQRWLFPQTAVVGGVTIQHPSMSILYAISHLALALFMFLVGLEFNVRILQGQSRHAGAISASGIVVPFALGASIALILYQEGGLFGQGISPSAAMLFLGVSMSITAFPVLSRMLQQFGITHTRLGSLVLATAAVDDITAWCLLALVLASLQHSSTVALVTIVGGVLYAIGMLTIGRRGLLVFERMAERNAGVSRELIVLTLLVVLVCSWLTTKIGIYEVFGAFAVGVAMPRGHLAVALRTRLEDLITGLLLPVFFVYSGLNTHLAMVNTPKLWLFTGSIIVIAITGKGLACTLAARLAGNTWRESATLGALMNARGLIELILLNIGLEANIITPTLFTMLVLMALFTTLMASPLYQWLYGQSAKDERTGTIIEETPRITSSLGN
jgi:Kef-type K+ transport system membrane component KefB